MSKIVLYCEKCKEARTAALSLADLRDGDILRVTCYKCKTQLAEVLPDRQAEGGKMLLAT